MMSRTFLLLLAACAGDDDASKPGDPADTASVDVDSGDTAPPCEHVWYADTDGDGYGDPDATATACEAPVGHVDDATDCDDSDGAVHPGATERCDDRDEDCDGEVDEAPADGDPWYRDADEDGFGDPDVVVLTCDGAPDGHVADPTDCDDTRDNAHPGADEVTRNAADDDCDGYIDLDAGSLDDATVFWETDGVNHDVWPIGENRDFYLGYAGLTMGPDTDGDGIEDLFVGGVRYLYSIPSTVTGGTRNVGDDATAIVSATEDNGTWYAVASLEDLDADGGRDIAAASLGDTYHAVIGVFSSTTLSGEIEASDASTSILLTDGSRFYPQSDELTAADFDGDGLDDLLVGDRYSARALVFTDLAMGLTLEAADASATLTRGIGESLGSTVAALGDVDGDGIVDAYVAGGSGWVLSGATLAGDVQVADEALAAVPVYEESGVLSADLDSDGPHEFMTWTPKQVMRDGTYWGGAVVVFRDLAGGGSRTTDDADAVIVRSDGYIRAAAAGGSLRGGAGDLVVVGSADGYDDILLVPVNAVSGTGVLDLADWGDATRADIGFGFGIPHLYDIEGDGDHDVATLNWAACSGYDSYGEACNATMPGVLTIFGNPR